MLDATLNYDVRNLDIKFVYSNLFDRLKSLNFNFKNISDFSKLKEYMSDEDFIDFIRLNYVLNIYTGVEAKLNIDPDIAKLFFVAVSGETKIKIPDTITPEIENRLSDTQYNITVLEYDKILVVVPEDFPGLLASKFTKFKDEFNYNLVSILNKHYPFRTLVKLAFFQHFLYSVIRLRNLFI